MTKDLNRTDYRDMEKELGAALDARKTVKIKIEVGYPNGSTVTPDIFKVTAYIDGVPKLFEFRQ